jgi:hypothetical protein
VTPTADTDKPGHTRTRTDALSALSQAMDGAGQYGLVLQARDHVERKKPLALPNLAIGMFQARYPEAPGRRKDEPQGEGAARGP